jgi:hypothetical protein
MKKLSPLRVERENLKRNIQKTEEALAYMDQSAFEAWCAYPEYRIYEEQNQRRYKRLADIERVLGGRD